MRRVRASGRSYLWAATAASLLLASVVSANEHRPRLLVVLVVDQMRADYVDTYGHQWSAGLRRLLDEGAWFRLAAYPYRSTVTCAGHATIATGSFPAKHGMVQNMWWDRASEQSITCTTDASAVPIAYGGQARERHSPSQLALPTVADVLRLTSEDRPRVVSLSLKPRSAVTLAGQAADAIAWFDEANTWATSTAYTDSPVAAIRHFVDAHAVETYVDAVWTRLLPLNEYLYDDDGLGEQPPEGWGTRFPHPLGGPEHSEGAAKTPGSSPERGFYSRWRASPLSDAYLAQMALAMIDAFELGATDRTDYLAIGFSALDYVGHRFGPRSHEVQDVLARLDVTLGVLFDTLDVRVGRDAYVVALSADHGVSPIPAFATAQGLDAGSMELQQLVPKLETLLTERRGRGPHVAALQGGDLYFAPGVYNALRNRPADLEAVLDVIKRTPGVWRAYPEEQLRHGDGQDDPIALAAKLSFFPGRSGDIILVPKPYWINSGLAASHGSPHAYDTRVPVLLLGSGIKPGQHLTSATPADIAPTLAFLTGITLPQPDGRVLTEALVRD